jgi:hypothetical protein
LAVYDGWHKTVRGLGRGLGGAPDVHRFSLSLTRNQADADDCQRARYWAEGDGDVALVARSDDEHLLTRLDLGPAICSALDRLTEPYRSVVVLVDLEDQSYETTAAILGVPIGTVRSRLFRARRQLRRTLGIFAHDAGFATGRAEVS